MSEHLDLRAQVYSGQHTGVFPLLDESLEPRSPELLFDIADAHLAPGIRVLDIGCRDAAQLVRLVEAHDVSGLGVDPVDRHVGLAAEAVVRARLRHRVVIAKATMERLPVASGSVDFIWRRDVLEHVGDLAAGLAEAVEADFAGAGLVIRHKEVVGTEWREHAEERTQLSRDLLRLARLRRRRAEIVERYSQGVYDRAEGGLQWAAYQLMGKLQPTIYLLARS